VAPPMAASEVPSYLRRVMAPLARRDQTRRE
jgi:hypothetical protein